MDGAPSKRLLQRQPFWHSPYSEPDAGAGAVHTITVIPPYSRKPAGEARYGAEPLINLSKSIVNLTLHERAPECENLQGEPMREIAIIITAALSAMSRGNAHFVPLPTGPLPAVNVP
jgi:hypothetical protein